MSASDPQALRYRICSGEVSLAPLNVLRTARVVVPGAAVRMHILGASHAVVVETGTETLTEMLTCTAGIDAEVLKDSAVEFEDETVVCVRAGLWEIRTRLWTSDRLQPPGARGGAWSGSLEHAFPGGQPGIAPLTRLDWRVLPVGLQLRTLHTYPPQRVAVHTETDILRTITR